MICGCRYIPEQEPKPQKLSNILWGWILPTWQATEDDVIAVAGTDAAVYLMLLKFGELVEGHVGEYESFSRLH